MFNSTLIRKGRTIRYQGGTMEYLEKKLLHKADEKKSSVTALMKKTIICHRPPLKKLSQYTCEQKRKKIVTSPYEKKSHNSLLQIGVDHRVGCF